MPIIAGLCLSATVASGADKADASAVEYRQAVLRVMGANVGPLVAMVRGATDYDADEVALRATRIHQMSQMLAEAFERDTSAADDLETEALDKIWANGADFADRVAAVQEASLALSKAPADPSAFKAAFGKLGQSCKGCHDNYRED